MSNIFPDHCLRGLRKKEHLTPDGNAIYTAAYLPDSRTSENRQDGCAETSINWEDDASALSFTLKQSSSAHGVARLRKDEIYEPARKNPALKNLVFYERVPMDGNPHHGNIVFAKEAQQHQIKTIANYFAMCAELIRRQNGQ